MADKVAIVTGASSGIGKEVVKVFAENNTANVIIMVARRKEILEQISKEISETYKVEAIPFPIDITVPTQIEECVNFVKEKYGRVDILINNAGVLKKYGALEEFSLEEWEELVNVNLRAPFLFMKLVIPIMKKQGSGIIINISSQAGKKPIENMAIYCATKYGLNGLTRSVAEEVYKYGIVVSLVSPGMVDTPIHPTPPNEEFKKKIMSPRDVAEVINFMVNHPETIRIVDIDILGRGSSF